MREDNNYNVYVMITQLIWTTLTRERLWNLIHSLTQLLQYTLTSNLSLTQLHTHKPISLKFSQKFSYPVFLAGWPLAMTASSSSSGPPSGDVAWTPCHMLQFAEILYKCTLCTTLPSILTSKDAFISHVHSVHLGNQAGLQACEKWGRLNTQA